MTMKKKKKKKIMLLIMMITMGIKLKIMKNDIKKIIQKKIEIIFKKKFIRINLISYGFKILLINSKIFIVNILMNCHRKKLRFSLLIKMQIK